MKKTLFILSIAGMTFLAACGQGANQKAAEQKAANTDSVAAAHRADSLTKAAQQHQKQDSVNNAKAADTVKGGDKK